MVRWPVRGKEWLGLEGRKQVEGKVSKRGKYLGEGREGGKEDKLR